MTTRTNKVFSFYTPLRNHLRKADLEGSLRAVHAHVQHQQFGKAIPPYIRNTPFGYNQAKSFTDFINFHVFPWELEVIAKELLIHGANIGGEKTLEDWNYLAGAVNKLKSLENEISKIYINKNKVLLEFHRMAHRQFKWQVRPNLQILARYWKIYIDKELSKIIQKATRLSVNDMYLVGIALIGFYVDKLALFYPPNIEIKGVGLNVLNNFLAHFAKDYDSLKNQLLQEQLLDERYMYAFNSLRAYPIVKMNYQDRSALVCPIPQLLYDRLIAGVYYEIYNQKGFDAAFGDSFQKYTGEVLRAGGKKIQIFPEKSYGGRRSKRKSVDWIICDKKSAIFLECKTKRLTFGAKGWLPYYVSKRAIEDLTIGLAEELKDKSIQVNAISPSDTATEAYKKYFPQYVKEAIEPEKIAKQAVFLCSPEANDITGKVSVVKKGEKPFEGFHY